jgi:hypothetical protein
MTVSVYNPQITVSLIKIIGRTDGVAQRYANAQRVVDLTPYLGDGSAVRTVRNITDPAGGFSITIPDQPDNQSGTADTFYASIEPMDLIEIRMARNPQYYARQPLKLIMRGFVSSVQRVESMRQDGTPQRFVVIRGNDFGKLWLIHQFLLAVAIALNEPAVDEFGLAVVNGLALRWETLNQFMADLTSVMNQKLATMLAFSQLPQNVTAGIKPFQTRATVPDGNVAPNLYGNFQGPVWNLAVQLADRPWNELFFEYDDQTEAPTLIFRPAPLKDLNGNLIMPGATDPGSNPTLDISAVQSLDLGRSDARIANVFMVPAGWSMLDAGMGINLSTIMMLGQGTAVDFEYGNNNPAFYGERMLELQTHVYPTTWETTPMLAPTGQQGALTTQGTAWNVQRMQELRAMNRDNSVWENGSAVVMGDENIKPGKYTPLTRGALTSSYYVTQVQHVFLPFRTWTTELTLERGTGFLVRNTYVGSPYWAEGRPSAYGSNS